MLYPERAGKPKACKCCGERPAKQKYLFCAGRWCESPEKWLAFCRVESKQVEARNGITKPTGLAIVDEWRGRDPMPVGDRLRSDADSFRPRGRTLASTATRRAQSDRPIYIPSERDIAQHDARRTLAYNAQAHRLHAILGDVGWPESEHWTRPTPDTESRLLSSCEIESLKRLASYSASPANGTAEPRHIFLNSAIPKRRRRRLFVGGGEETDEPVAPIELAVCSRCGFGYSHLLTGGEKICFECRIDDVVKNESRLALL